MRVVSTMAWRSAALAVLAAACFVPATARAESPLALRLGIYGSTSYQSRMLADNKGFIAGLQYTLGGVPSVLNGEMWSTSISVDYYGRFTKKSQSLFQAIPVSINQVYTFEEQNGKTPYAGFCITAITYRSSLHAAYEQPWLTRIGGGLILGLNLNDKMFIEGRYEMFDKGSAAATPEGFRALLGLRF